MIELSTSAAINLYLGMTLTIILGIWFYHHYTGRYKKVITTDRELLVCEFCHFAYLCEKEKTVTQCPQCQSYNKNNPYRH
jgi:hypothetical protein